MAATASKQQNRSQPNWHPPVRSRQRSEQAAILSLSCFTVTALALNYPAESTVVLVFNPFDAVIMNKFAAAMESSLAESPGEFYSIYVHRYAEQLFRIETLEKDMKNAGDITSSYINGSTSLVSSALIKWNSGRGRRPFQLIRHED